MHQLEHSNMCRKMFFEAQKDAKERVIDPDLRPLADQLFKVLEQGEIQKFYTFIMFESGSIETSYTNFKRLMENARDIEQYLGYDFD